MPYSLSTAPRRLSEIAEDLGLSQSTVSRALSGKGRVSQDTRKRVMQYIQETGYRPNSIAKGLAQKKTFNLCALLPEDALSSQMPFFHECLMGIGSAAVKHDYDVIITTVSETNCEQLKRVIFADKADGYIIMRAVSDDQAMALLKSHGLPFVLIGSCDEDDVPCVDTDNAASSEKLTLSVIDEGSSRPALLLGNMRYAVNRSRAKGFYQALEKRSLPSPAVYDGLGTAEEINSALSAAVGAGADAIVCGDDFICGQVLKELRGTEAKMPVASLYGSSMLSLIGTVKMAEFADARELGAQAAEKLLTIID